MAVCMVLQTAMFAHADETNIETEIQEEKYDEASENLNLTEDDIVQESILDESDDNEEADSNIDEQPIDEYNDFEQYWK